VVRCFGHSFLLWDTALGSFITEAFNCNHRFLTSVELRRQVEERKLLLQEVENEQAVNRMTDALLVHKADGRPGGSKRWCSKCKKSTHETS
jgi:hypothetical protein